MNGVDARHSHDSFSKRSKNILPKMWSKLFLFPRGAYESAVGNRKLGVCVDARKSAPPSEIHNLPHLRAHDLRKFLQCHMMRNENYWPNSESFV